MIIVKYLKPFIFPLILAIALLAVQAYGELALPEITGRLVNTGIQNGGIDSAAPEVIRESELDQIAATAEIMGMDADGLRAGYKPLAKTDKNVKKYPSLAAETILSRTDNSEEFELIMGRAVMARGYFREDGASSPSVTAGAARIDALSITEIRYAASSYIRGEYEAMGIDPDDFQMSYVFGAGAYMLLMTLLIAIAVIFEAFFAARVAGGLARDLRRATFNKIVSFSSKEMDKFSTASLITRSTNDITQIQNVVMFGLRIIVYSPIMALGGVFKVMGTEADMVWVIGLAVAVLMTVVITLMAVAIPKFRVVQTFIDKVNLVMRESLSGMLVVRAFSNQKLEEAKFDKANKDLTGLNLFVARLMSLMFPVMTIIMNGVTIMIVWFGGKEIDAGALQTGDMMAFMTYAIQIIMSFLMISMVSMILPRAIVSGRRIAEVLSTESSIADPVSPEKFSADKEGTIEFKNVSFKYPGAEDYVLKDVTFTANKGQTTAFIGGTGSGKTTVVSLIPRFYDATEGEVTVNGVNVKNALQHDLRKGIGFVPQKGLLFSGTIESNLKYGSSADGDNKTVSDDDMRKAAEIAQAAEFIDEKPEKFGEVIAQGGTNVSGGQRQRLSIARAIAKRPNIYIFDDSFSALDYKTDAALRGAINRELGGATVLIVAQRIGTIKNAEKIVVLDQGEVVGQGTHRELLDNCEIYKQIALSQLSQEELDRDLAQADGGDKR